MSVIPHVQAANKFGKIYDIEGTVRFIPVGGKEEKITRDKDLLRGVAEGDIIEVRGAGRVVIASFADRRSYIIESDSIATMKQNEVKAIKGKVNIRQRSVYMGVGEALGSPMLGIVLRGVQPCVRTVAPVNTVILTLTPELKWQNSCSGSPKVEVEVLRDIDDERVYSTVTEGGSIELPKGTLSYGMVYRWVVKGRGDYNVSLATIRIPLEEEARKIALGIADYKMKTHELPDRFSLVYYLMEKGLNQQAQTEIESLAKEFPENAHLEELLKKVK